MKNHAIKIYLSIIVLLMTMLTTVLCIHFYKETVILNAKKIGSVSTLALVATVAAFKIKVKGYSISDRTASCVVQLGFLLMGIISEFLACFNLTTTGASND